MTFEKFFETYRADMMPLARLNTWLTKESIVKSKIMSWFDAMRMDEIKPIDVVRWQNDLMGRKQENGKSFSAVAIADLMGHESADITFRYAHLFPGARG